MKRFGFLVGLLMGTLLLTNGGVLAKNIGQDPGYLVTHTVTVIEYTTPYQIGQPIAGALVRVSNEQNQLLSSSYTNDVGQVQFNASNVTLIYVVIKGGYNQGVTSSSNTNVDMMLQPNQGDDIITVLDRDCPPQMVENPIACAQVIIIPANPLQTSIIGYTNDHGVFAFDLLGSTYGTYNISKPGYTTVTGAIVLDPTQQHIDMAVYLDSLFAPKQPDNPNN